jgi:iron complex outermembrane receptor protein
MSKYKNDRHLLRFSGLVGLLFAVLTLSAADGQDQADLTKMSLEDLMGMEVTSVTRRNQSLSRSAAAIYVITSDDIRRSAATTVPELLRTVPGLLVSRLSGHQWSVSSRTPGGRYVANLLVLVDGRTVYTPLFSGVIWEDHEFVMEDIDRIEVIRGPGAVVWGSNAVSGVINIITKTAGKTRGDLVSATTGNLNQGVAQMRHGGNIGSSGSYRVFGRLGRYGNLVDLEGNQVQDGYSTNMGGVRVDLAGSGGGRLMLEGSMQTGTVRQREFAPSLSTGQTAIENTEGNVSAGHILGRWSQTRTGGAETRVQLYYDWYDRTPFLSEARHTLDLDMSHTLQLGARHSLIAGGGYRESWDSVPPTARVKLIPPRASLGLANVYVQDQVRLGETTSFSIGARFEYDRFSGGSIQPAAQFLWTPTERQSVWASVSRALRTPSRGERGFSLLVGVLPPAATGAPLPLTITAVGQREMKAEDLLAYEAGYRNQISKKWSVDLAAYFYDARRMRAFLPYKPPALSLFPALHIDQEMMMVNGKQARNWGGEAALNYSVTGSWRLSGWYARMGQRQYLDAGMWNGGVGPMPHDSAALRSQTDLGRRLMFDTDVYFTGRPFEGLGQPASSILAGLQNMPAPGHAVRLDTRLTWKVSSAWELTAGGENLLDRYHLEITPEPIVVGSLVRRSWFVRLQWRH